MYKTIIIVIVTLLLAVLLLFGANYLYKIYTYQKTISAISFTTLDLNKIADGVYDGSFDATMITAKVSVSVENHVITDIVLVEHDNDRGAAAEVIVNSVKTKQSLNVDTISGATNSSKVILKAIENALLNGAE